MRYPVGKDLTDFKKNWYNAQGFGVKTSYGYHDGDDFNLKTGGDSDLGQPLYAICDGEISGVDTTSKTGFGKQIFLKFEDPLKKGSFYWSHYAHCDSVLVKAGQKVKEGDKLGTLGKSGTQYAHLHFAIKNTPNGMDNIPNSLDELKEWENPTKFIEARLDSGSTKMLKDTVIDFDDGEGKRKTVGWYISEWYGEKQRAEKLVVENELLVKELDKLRSENSKLREVNAKLSTENTEITGKNIALMNEITNLQKKVAEAEELRKVSENALQEATESIDRLGQEIERLKLSLDSCKKQNLDHLTLGDFLAWVGMKLGIKK